MRPPPAPTRNSICIRCWAYDRIAFYCVFGNPIPSSSKWCEWARKQKPFEMGRNSLWDLEGKSAMRDVNKIIWLACMALVRLAMDESYRTNRPSVDRWRSRQTVGWQMQLKLNQYMKFAESNCGKWRRLGIPAMHITSIHYVLRVLSGLRSDFIGITGCTNKLADTCYPVRRVTTVHLLE